MADDHSQSLNWNDTTRISCDFTFKCPKTWEWLIQTENATVRHCSECDRDVYLVLTEEDLRRHGEAGHCVAVSVKEEDSFGSYVGNLMPPYDAQKNGW
jgi:hypothetical protein